jgi:hypothetical protein
MRSSPVILLRPHSAVYLLIRQLLVFDVRKSLGRRVPWVELQLKESEAAARDLGQEIQIFNAGSERDFEATFAAIVPS